MTVLSLTWFPPSHAWVGFYGDRQNVNLRVLNAGRETMEGSKICRLLQAWLLENTGGRFRSM